MNARVRAPRAVSHDVFTGIATGIGSWPGTNPVESAAVIVGELPGLAHLVELPQRGIGADIIGRSGALLVDLPLDTTARGYRVAARCGAVTRRARALLREDLDALEEAWERAGRPGAAVKVAAAGPLTLAAELEVAGGHRALIDTAAVRDISASLAEGVREHRHELAERLDAEVVVQLDEPSLPAVLAGTLPGVTGIDRVPAVPEVDALATLDGVIAGIGGPVAVHCCAADVPWSMLGRSAATAVMVDSAHVHTDRLDDIGELIDGGTDVVLGLVPAHPGVGVEPLWRTLAEPAVALVDRLGFPRTFLTSRVGVSPACGLAGASAAWARRALCLCRDIATAFAEEPEGL